MPNRIATSLRVAIARALHSWPTTLALRTENAVASITARYGGKAPLGAVGPELTGWRANATFRVEERRVLIRELPEIVAHHVSNISLQAMGHVDSMDSDELRNAIVEASRSAHSALNELRLLIVVLRDDLPAMADAEVDRLAPEAGPTAVAARWSRRLSEAGLGAAIDVPMQADLLGDTIRTTIIRALDVAGHQALRYAPPGARCTITLVIKPTHVVFYGDVPLSRRVEQRLAVLEASLQRLRARVELTGGAFNGGMPDSGTEDVKQVFVIVLPRG